MMFFLQAKNETTGQEYQRTGCSENIECSHLSTPFKTSFFTFHILSQLSDISHMYADINSIDSLSRGMASGQAPRLSPAMLAGGQSQNKLLHSELSFGSAGFYRVIHLAQPLQKSTYLLQ